MTRSDKSKLHRDDVMHLDDKSKRDYFAGIRIRHELIRGTLEDLQTLMDPESGADVILLVGPTGVGKSTLAVSLHQDVLQRNAGRMQADPGFVPSIYIMACASGEMQFSWRGFYWDGGKQLAEPLLQKKVETRVAEGRTSVTPFSGGCTVIALRMAFESAIQHRGTTVAVIDEAVHLISGASGPKLKSQMEAIKSIAQRTSCKIALVGSYDLFDLLNIQAQLTRRIGVVHFRRYLTGDKADEAAFAKVVRTLQSHLPIECPNLEQYAPELMRSCVGCVGILKETLQRMLAFSLRDGGTWREKHLAKALLTETQVKSVLSEALRGEGRVKTTEFGSGLLQSTQDKAA